MSIEGKSSTAFDALRTPPSSPEQKGIRFSPHPAYDTYLRIHKVLVGEATAKKLELIHEALRDETMPRYLSVAGWAAAEAALAQPRLNARYRNELLEQAGQRWTEALENQLRINEYGDPELVELSEAYHFALDLAHLPLLQAMVSGNVTNTVRQHVALDVLNIAEANSIQLSLALKDGAPHQISDHVGIAHECNALLTFHSFDSPSLFAIPSSARADSGYYHPGQTHDILAIQQKWGILKDMTPIEIKSKASRSDRLRYKALLIRGKMHLCITGKYSPDNTLKAFSGLFNGSQTPAENRITDHARHTVLDMYWRYKQGSPLSGFASDSSICQYRELDSVHDAYPEVAPT